VSASNGGDLSSRPRSTSRRDTGSALRQAFVGASVLWASLLPLASFAASRVHAASVVYAGAAAVYVVGSALCHQRPERSFHLWGVQLPVCARCVGIYVGGAVAAVMAAAGAGGGLRRGPRPSRWLAPAAIRIGLVAAALPTLATLAYEWTTGDVPANVMRAMAGAPLGAIVAWLVVRQTRTLASAVEAADG
jgi:hypothetical protein